MPGVSAQLEEWSIVALEVASGQDSHFPGVQVHTRTSITKAANVQKARHFLRKTIFSPPLHIADLYIQPGTVS